MTRSHAALRDGRTLAGKRPSFLLVDALLVLVVLLAPCLMGGAHPLGRLVLVTLAGMTAVAWCVQNAVHAQREGPTRWRTSSLVWLWLAGSLLVVLQGMPLPADWLGWLSPNLSRLLPLWQPGTPVESLGSWQTISLLPVETRRGLVLLLAYGLLFLTVLQRLNDWQDIVGLLKLVAAGGILIAIISLAQRFAGNGKFLWVYEHPFRHPGPATKGPFTNENHLAGFLCLTIAPLFFLARLAPPEKRSRRSSNGWGAAAGPLSPHVEASSYWLAGLIMVVLTILLTYSRGGMLTFAAGAAVIAILTWRLRIPVKRAGSGVWLGLFVIVAALSVYGAAPMLREMGRIDFDLAKMSNVRVELWAAVIKAIPDYWMLGTGVGAHREVYLRYFSTPLDVELTHAENGYLQVLLETGAVGLALLLTGWWIVIRGGWQICSKAGADSTLPEVSWRRAIAVCVLAGAAVSLVQSLVDFVWYIPACMTVTVLLAAAAIRGEQLVVEAAARDGSEAVDQGTGTATGNRSRAPRQRVLWLAAAVGAAVGACWMVHVALPAAKARPHFESYMRLARDARKRASRFDDLHLLEQMKQHLSDAVSADPDRARFRIRLASVYMKLFEQRQADGENPMPLPHLRDACAASKDAFGAIENQMAWLRRAVGDNLKNAEAALEHARTALRLCPMQGDAYVFVAELEMLYTLDSQREWLLKQALRVRPYSASVLFTVGAHFAMEGDTQRAIQYWRVAFHRKVEIRRLLLATFAPQADAQQMLRDLRPTYEMLPDVRTAYLHAKRPDQANQVARVMAQVAERQAREGDDTKWKSAQQGWTWAGLHSRAALCGLEAVKASPTDYQVRKRLGASLVVVGQKREAATHLQWCQRRDPDDLEVQELLRR